MNKEEFLQLENELFLIFNNFGKSTEVLNCYTFLQLRTAFYKNCVTKLRDFYDKIDKKSGDNWEFVEIETIFLYILLGCDEKSNITFEDQVYKNMRDYFQIKMKYFEDGYSFCLDRILNSLFIFINMYYKSNFDTEKMTTILLKEVHEYFENKKKEDERIEDLFDRSDWSTNRVSSEDKRKIAEELLNEPLTFGPKFEVSKDKIDLNPTSYAVNSFSTEFIVTNSSVKDRNEKISEDDLTNLEIAFNTAKSFEDFLNSI